MKIRGSFALKRSSLDASNAIVLTFNHRWHASLLRGDVSIVFRKSGPTDFTPDLLYAYISAPTSSISFRMSIDSYEVLPIEDAISFAKGSQLSKSEILDYAASNPNLIVMKVGPIRVARSPITCDYLGRNYNFWPSSTFIPLSTAGIARLDELGNFQPIVEL